ncbi:recombinase family protein [Polaromonas sp. YR568]|uniref:recombinase family protein n=1 Tax=Polaromonas sp. YR568 TaxID=1855301 RepID=UPI00313822B8
MLIGYARVSTREQETDLQLDALQRAGVTKIFQEKASSVGLRLQLTAAIASLRPGDLLVVYKIDRFARSLKDLLTILDRIADAGASIRSLSEPLDTSSPLGVFMVQILGAVAQLERSMIRERSMAGQAAAIQRGVRVGRPRTIPDDDVADVLRLWNSGHYTLDSVAFVFDAHPSAIKRLIYASSRHGLRKGDRRGKLLH